MTRKVLSESLWWFAWGAVAQLLTGALASIRGQNHYLDVVSEHPRFVAFFTLLGCANMALAAPLGTRSGGQTLQRAWGGALLALGVALGAPAGVLAWVIIAVAGAWWLGTAYWVRPQIGWHALTRGSILWLAGFVVFDLFFDVPFLASGAPKTLALTVLNNTAHNDTLVHVVWLPLAMVMAAVCVARNAVFDRTWLDYALAALFVVGGVLLWVIIEPLEAQLLTVVDDPIKAATLVQSVGTSHVIATAVLVAALFLLSRKAIPTSR